MTVLEWTVRALTSVGIRTKILGMVGGIVLAMGVAVTFQVRTQLTHLLRAELDARAETLVRDLAARGADLILTDNRLALRELVRDAVRHNPDVRYAFFLDIEGEVLSHTFVRGVPVALASLSADGRGEPRIRVVETEEGRLTDIEAPVLAGRAGVARVGLSHSRMQAATTRLTRWLLTVTGLALVGALGIALILTRILTRPLLELVDISKAVERGDLTVRAEKRADDEIGELTNAFNATIAALSRSQEDLVRRMRELGTLNDTAATVTGTANIDAVLQVALERVVAVMQAPGGCIALLSDGNARHVAAIGATCGSPAKGGSRCSARATPEEFGPRICSNRPDAPPGEPCEPSALCHIDVPLAVSDRRVGMLSITCPPGCKFSPEELSLLEAVGRQLGLAVENARLWADAEARQARRGQWLTQVIAAQESERRRVARELHDVAGQMLTALSVGLRSLEESTGLPSSARAPVTDLKELARRLMEELHRMAVELRPAALDQLGLVGALEGYLREFGTRTGIDARMDSTSAPADGLSADVEIAAYRVVQEALTNVAKHAAATEVDVLVGRRNGSLIAVIEDNGRGFDTGASSGEGRPCLGLFGMRERAELLGGRLDVESAPGAGTTVFLELPIGVRQ